MRNALDTCFRKSCVKLISEFYVYMCNAICVPKLSLPGSFTVSIMWKKNLLYLLLITPTTSLPCTDELIPWSIIISKAYDNIVNNYNSVAHL